MKKSKKLNRKGFTLVELIVVIAILAILAGVAIPVYSSYISKANEAADYTMLDAVKTAAVFAATEAGIKKNPPVAPTVKEIVVDANGTITVTTDPSVSVTQAEIEQYVQNSITFKSGATKATWTQNTSGAAWALTPKGTTTTTTSTSTSTSGNNG